jgi:hypothetical protein
MFTSGTNTATIRVVLSNIQAWLKKLTTKFGKNCPRSILFSKAVREQGHIGLDQ